MYFQKCTNCGHLNEVKSEYLIFCGKCNKKLENNFSEWHKHNSDKTFNDFKLLCCISAQDIMSNTQATKKTTGMPKWLIAWSVVAAVVAPTLGYFIYSHISNIKAAFGSAILHKASSDMLTGKWTKQTYGVTGLSVETPKKVDPRGLELPDNVKALIDRMDVYQSDSSDGFVILITSTRYKPVVGQGNLQGGADGAVNNIKAAKEVTDFKYTEEHIEKDSVPGILQKGSYTFNGLVKTEFIDAIFVKSLLCCQVMVIYQADDEIARKAGKRVIDSIEIAQANSL